LGSRVRSLAPSARSTLRLCSGLCRFTRSAGMRSESEPLADQLKRLKVTFEPRGEEVDRPIPLTGGRHERAPYEDLDVVLDRPVLQVQNRGELVHVARLRPEGPDYPRSVLAAPLPSEKEPECPAELRVLFHSSIQKSRSYLALG